MSDKRQVIVQAALEVIAEGGLAAFTQTRVAHRSGLRQSHLTYYFPTRNDLLFAVAEQAVQERLDALRQAQAAGGPDQRLRALAALLTSPEQTRILVALAQAADQFDEVRATFGDLAAGVAPLSAALLADFGVEPDAASSALLQATSTGIAVLALARGREVADAGEGLLRGLLAGLRSGTPTATSSGSASSGAGASGDSA